MRLALAACLAASFALPAAAQAQSTPSASAIISGFNAFTQGNFTTGHDVEGPFVVGGNLSGSGSVFNLGIPLGVTLSGFGSVNVYGNAAGATYNTNGLNVRVGAASGGSFSGAASVTYNASFPATAGAMWGQITTLSSPPACPTSPPPRRPAPSRPPAATTPSSPPPRPA